MSGQWDPIRVVGCGSPVGDDALAWEVLDRLRAASLPEGVELHAVEGGHQVLDVLDRRGTLILVDAVCSGEQAGTVHRFEWPDTRLQTLRPGSTHSVRPAEALQLAATLGLLPSRVIVFGIEAATMEPGAGLSPDVDSSVPIVVRRILEELERARDVVAARADESD
ncbi:MAG: hydrogenase maturation protease [Planctomycetes bacterium]|nr:hydrogenase maturation protease [Planctomycetota bacterium]